MIGLLFCMLLHAVVQGIGTHLVTCQRQPALGCVFKLVEVNSKPKIKLSQDVQKVGETVLFTVCTLFYSQVTMPGQKDAFRLYSSDGHALIDLLQRPGEQPPEVGKRVLCRLGQDCSLIWTLPLPCSGIRSRSLSVRT